MDVGCRFECGSAFELTDQAIPTDELSHCIELAMTYHLTPIAPPEQLVKAGIEAGPGGVDRVAAGYRPRSPRT